MKKFHMLILVISTSLLAIPPDPNIADIVLNEILFNPHDISGTALGQDCNGDGIPGQDGNSNSNAGDEFVEFYNNGVTDVDIGNYCLSHDLITVVGTPPDANSRWLIPNGVIVPAGGFYHICGDNDGRGFGFSILDANGDEIQQFANSGAGNGRSVSLYQPTIVEDLTAIPPIPATLCGSGVAVVIFSQGYSANAESNGESFLRCFTDGTSLLGYYDDGGIPANFYHPSPGTSNCAVATPVYINFIDYSQNKLNWQAGMEFNHIGYNIYQNNADKLTKINSKIIKGNLSHDYSYTIEKQYLGSDLIITAVDVLGQEQRLDVISYDETHGVYEGTNDIKWLKKPTPVSNLNKTQASVKQINVMVDSDGMQKISVDELSNQGMDIIGLTPYQINLRLNQKSTAYMIYPQSDVFTASSYLVFIGKKADSLYSDTNIYTLSKAKNMSLIDGKSAYPSEDRVFEDFYMKTIVVEENNFYEFSSVSADPWQMKKLASYGEESAHQWQIQLDEISQSERATINPISITAFLNGVTDFPGLEKDHHIILKLAGETDQSIYFDGQESIQLKTTIRNTLQNNEISVNLVQPADTGFAYDLVNLDKFVVSYPRNFMANNGQIDFTFNQNSNKKFDKPLKQYKIASFSNNDIIILSQDHIRTFSLTDYVYNTVDNITEIQFQSNHQNAHLYLSQFDKIATPQLANQQKPQLIETDFLILTQKFLMPELAGYIEDKTQQGFKVNTVNVDDIYTDYGSTQNNPDSIKAYIKDLNKINSLKYVMIVGIDQYDYKNYLDTPAYNIVPTFYRNTGFGINYAPTDTPYVDFDNDDIADIAIGRLTVKSTKELSNLLDKINNYNSRIHGTRLIITDNVDHRNFNAIANQLKQNSTDDIHIINSHQLGIQQANNQIIDSLNQGADFITWIGHSSSTRWSRDNIFDINDIEQLENSPAVVFQLGCWNSYFVDPIRQSFSNALLQKQQYGAVATIGSSTYTKSDGEKQFTLFFNEYISNNQNATIGNAFVYALKEFGSRYPMRKDILLGYQLLGDPSMVID